MSSLPPNFKFGGPPPGSTPVGLSNIKSAPFSAGEPEGDEEALGGGAGIAKMFYAIERSLDSLAMAIPTQAAEIDKIKNSLREVLASALSNGAAFAGSDDQGPNVRPGPSEPLI